MIRVRLSQRDGLCRLCGVARLVNALVFSGEVVTPVLIGVAVLMRARSLRIASAPSRPQRAPVMSMRSRTKWGSSSF